MIRYSGQTIFIHIGKNKYEPHEDVYLPVRIWGTNLLISKPRWGKSSLAKHIAVQLSKQRRVIIFDYNGEWENHVQKYNKKAFAPMKMTNVKVINNITFKISDMDNPASWISLGFSDMPTSVITHIVSKCKKDYQDNPDKFLRLLASLPTNKEELADFNMNYETDIMMPVHYATKQSIINHFQFIKNWFWFEEDKRYYYNWERELLKNDHLIIDLSLGFDRGSNVARARTICGLALSRWRTLYSLVHPAIFFEESKMLAPNLQNAFFYPSSLVEIADLTTLLPKTGVTTFFVFQEEKQVHQEICELYHTKILGIVDKVQGEEYELAKKLRWYEDSDYREGLLYYTSRQYSFFVPDIACCVV